MYWNCFFCQAPARFATNFYNRIRKKRVAGNETLGFFFPLPSSIFSSRPTQNRLSPSTTSLATSSTTLGLFRQQLSAAVLPLLHPRPRQNSCPPHHLGLLVRKEHVFSCFLFPVFFLRMRMQRRKQIFFCGVTVRDTWLNRVPIKIWHTAFPRH